jgi:cytochrome P450
MKPVAAVRYDLTDAGLLFRPDVLADPTGLYAQLRDEAPVWEIPRSSTFLVTRADLVSEAVARPEDFSSNLTSLIYRGADGGAEVFDMSPLGHAIHVLATADPPVHTRHRRLMQPLLTPGAVARFERWTTGAADELQHDLLAAGRGDYVAHVADLLPMRVLSMLVGFPADDVPRLVKLVLDVDQILAGVSDADAMARAAASAAEQAEYLAEHLGHAVAARGDGAAGDAATADATAEPPTMLSHVARAVTEGELSFEEGVGILVQILGAGTETTTSLIGTAAKVLAQDRALQQTLRADPDLVPTFLEEVLRVDGPFRFHYRSVPRDTQLGGVAIPAGSRVMLMWGAANLDGAAYPDADRLDLDRPIPKSHLAFGRGIHFCIGAPLARLEARVAITRLLAATTSFELDDDLPPRLHPDIFLRRLSQLGLRVTAA